MMRWLFLVIVLLGLYSVLPANADEIRPALLDIKEQNTGLFAVTWKVPTRGDRVLAITPHLPESLELLGSPTVQDVPGARIKHATYKNNGESLTGQTIAIDGLSALQTDVLLLVQLRDGTQHSAILRPSSPEFTVPLEASKLEVAADYWRLGTIHILEGVDHLLFVLALMLIVTGFGQLLKAVTAFTVAHSITLGVATLGFINVPSAPVESAIALSIVFLCVEIIHAQQGRAGITLTYPWIVAFAFGLLHGLGFAGALSEIGLPPAEIPMALLFFNIGVEIGQLMFVALVLGIIWGLRKVQPESWRWTSAVPAYVIGTIATYWLFERVVAIFVGV
jgi:hydrogenase/urease accessory protein HupE